MAKYITTYRVALVVNADSPGEAIDKGFDCINEALETSTGDVRLREDGILWMDFFDYPTPDESLLT
jgi:hypothetical protein